ncbi:hypothetical protein [Spongiactinospora sp. TRM90649]|uniref:hypothetical protein n=1 Tax=Spongiactinospora sp. TRM90649 TaxID=3031114 RepID=UPI0023F8C013|nr:hypothetical protein [Spongiactinospora sp. TRM90649]MDF5752714.1 hypothetical protein [Spongiactinospora sp. TRM90649]
MTTPHTTAPQTAGPDTTTSETTGPNTTGIRAAGADTTTREATTHSTSGDHTTGLRGARRHATGLSIATPGNAGVRAARAEVAEPGAAETGPQTDASEVIRTRSSKGAHEGRGHAWWHFLRHYLEMIAAMFVGMAILGGATRGVLALMGLEFPSHLTELATLEMAFDMSVGMIVWMRFRGHGWASTLEMSAAMFAPAIALFPLLWLDMISADDLMLLEHLAMLPLMFLLMLRRRAEYGGASHA